MTDRQLFDSFGIPNGQAQTHAEDAHIPAHDDAQAAPKLAELGQVPLFPVGTLPPRGTKRGQSLLDL